MYELKKIYKVTDKWLGSIDYTTVEIIAATVLANRMVGPPVWLVVEGSWKEFQLLKALEGLDRVHPFSDLTPGTFVSGIARFGHPGLLQKIDASKPHIVLLKDLAALFRRRYDARTEIMIQLRLIYDGTYDKHWGTGEEIHWKGKISVIAGCPPVRDLVLNKLNLLRERFLVWRAPAGGGQAKPPRQWYTDETDQMEDELRSTFKLLDDIETPKRVSIGKEIMDEWVGLMSLLATMRTPLRRDGRTREIIESPNTEAVGHLANLTGQLLRSLAVLRGRKEAGQAELETVKQVIFSSMPPERVQVMRAMPPEGASSAEISRRIGLPKTQVYRVFEELEVLGLVDRRNGRFHPTEEARLFYDGTVETPAA